MSNPLPSKLKEKTPLNDFICNLEKAGNQKNKEAQFRLAILYFRGDFGHVRNLEDAYKWFKMAAADGTHAFSIFYQGYCLLHGMGITPDIPRAIQLLQQARTMNCVDAVFQLGECYEKGFGVVEDQKQGFLLYQEALKLAENNTETEAKTLAKIRANLARCYSLGKGTGKDEKKAIEELNLIGGVDLPQVEWTIGNLNEKLNQDAGDETQTFARYKSAADQGHVEAMMKVADAYLDGRGTNADLKKGVEYLERAAKRDHPEALLRTGKHYLAGHGVKKDHRIAIKYFKKAFHEFRHEPAMYYLALCNVLFGSNEEQASGFAMLNSLASAGDLAARFRVGWCYLLGRGVEKNPHKAIEILENCVAADPESIDYMNMLATALMFTKPRLQDRERGFKLLKTAESLFYNEMLASDETYQMLARCYRFGYGTVQNDQKAIEYLNRSAGLGNNSSKVMLALCHFHGIGGGKDSKQAIKILKEMVNINCTAALTSWGIFAFTGWAGEKPNAKKAFNLFKQATDSDFLHHESDHINNQGWCYLHGLGTEQDYALAIKNFEESRVRGNRCAVNNLAWCYLNGFGVSKDVAKATSLFLEAQETSEEENLANTLGMSYLAYWSVESEFLRLEQTEDACILYNLSLCYINGFGLPKNLKKAIELLTRLATQNKYPAAMLKLGICYLGGVGVEAQSLDNDKKAFALFSELADYQSPDQVNKFIEIEKKVRKDIDSDLDSEPLQDEETGYTETMPMPLSAASTTKEISHQYPRIDHKISAYIQLALCKIDGRGVMKNLEKGFSLLKLCSDMGHPEAEFYMGALYAFGKIPHQVGRVDKQQAFKWFNKAALKGYLPARRFIASYYEQGQGVAKDLKQAFEHYKVLAEHGDAIAENNLGILYEKGEGTTQNLELAFQCYERSARRGNFMLGWYHLGRCYELGVGTKPNLKSAQHCYKQAALLGHKISQQILKMISTLETNTIAEQDTITFHNEISLMKEHDSREKKMQAACKPSNTCPATAEDNNLPSTQRTFLPLLSGLQGIDKMVSEMAPKKKNLTENCRM